MKAKAIIVDENDIPVGLKYRDEWTDADIHRVSALWLTNPQGEIFLAQRAFTKMHAPGKWGQAVGGTVDEGETYESNIIKESEEEIGLSLSPNTLEKGPKVFIKAPQNNHFVQFFLAQIDRPAKDFRLAEGEVIAAKWVSSEALKRELSEHPENFATSAHVWPGIFLNE